MCIELAKSGLSEIAIVTACKHLCGVSQEISQGNALMFASSLLLPTVSKTGTKHSLYLIVHNANT